MIELTKKSDCCGCHACSNICPKQCISMKSDNEGFGYPVTNEDKCINCDLCIKVCPIINTPKRMENVTNGYACKNKNDIIRKYSSSGGVFFLMCEDVIKSNGIVFGAAFDNDLSVKHMYAKTLEECEKFRGSKYVQSKIGDTYIKVREFLKNGRIVLFSGTPCQISGLESFLMKKYENLIMIDVACHGVPSPLVYKNYIEFLKEKNKSEIKSLSFRDKSTGWSQYSVRFNLKNGSTVKERGADNIYMRGFLSNIYLRPSCYDCKFKKPITSADITLADYWGIQNIHPEFDDDKGTSLVLAHTKKGQDVLKKISSNMNIIKTDIDYAVSCNPCISRPIKSNPKREQFFRKLNENSIEKNIHRYTKITFRQKIKRRVFHVLRCIKNN